MIVNVVSFDTSDLYLINSIVELFCPNIYFKSSCLIHIVQLLLTWIPMYLGMSTLSAKTKRILQSYIKDVRYSLTKKNKILKRL